MLKDKTSFADLIRFALLLSGMLTALLATITFIENRYNTYSDICHLGFLLQ